MADDQTMNQNQTDESTTVSPLRRVPAIRALLAIRYALSAALAVTGLMLAALFPALMLTAVVLEHGGAPVAPPLCLVMTVLSLASGLGLGCLGAARSTRSEPSNMLLLGGGLWAMGALPMGFGGALLRFCLGGVLMGLGLSLCCCGAHRLTPVMKDILRFLGEGERWQALRRERNMMSMYSAVEALLLCTLAMHLMRTRFRLVLGLAALISLAVLLICTLNCPMDRRFLHKLRRCLTMEEPPAPLRAQVESVVQEKHRRPWFILMVIRTLQRIYPHRRKGEEHLHMDEENPLVYLCNHGSIYGPVAAMLFIPEKVRPWSISKIMVDRQETEEYLYKYNFGPAKWLPGFLKMPVTRLVARISHWGMKSLEAIPVFRDKPAQLRKTFRMAVDALVCGDPMLIFPENPNAEAQDHGYERQGMGTLFSGFAMLAPAYYNRTGKRCRFMPMYAHRDSRTVAFGEEIVFNPENDPAEERERLVREIGEQMNRLCAEMEG